MQFTFINLIQIICCIKTVSNYLNKIKIREKKNEREHKSAQHSGKGPAPIFNGQASRRREGPTRPGSLRLVRGN